MYIFIIMGICIIAGIIISISQLHNESNNRNESLSLVENKPDFNSSTTIKGNYCHSMVLSNDEQNQKIFCAVGTRREYYSYSDVLSAELIEDGNKTDIKKSALGTIGGAVVGGALAGGAGAIIGGLSSKSTSTNKISRMSVHVLLKSTSIPAFDFVFIDYETKTDSITYKLAKMEATKVMDFFKVIIDRADAMQNKPTIENLTINVSRADEIKKLSDLLAAGVITDEEFAKMKSRIIGQ